MGEQNDQSSRGVGLFFDLFGANATASSMSAWVWGVSRIIDSLELTPKAGINLEKIAVTGCSRDGKGALMAGAFEPRIALTIPQESGSGGDTCVSDRSICSTRSTTHIIIYKVASLEVRARQRRRRPTGNRDRHGKCLVLRELRQFRQ